MNKDRQSHR